MLPLGPGGCGAYRSIADEVVHGIFGGGTGACWRAARRRRCRAYENGRSPYAAASDFDAPYAAPQPVPGPNTPGPRYGYGPSLLPSTEVYAVLRDNGFSPLGIPQAPRLRLHDCGDRPRRRGRPADHRRAQRPDHPLPAGLPHGRRQFNEEPERPPRSSGAHRRRPMRQHGAGPCPGRAAAVTAGSTCREPHGAGAEGQPARRQTRRREPVKQAAAPAPKPAEVQAAARRP